MSNILRKTIIIGNKFTNTIGDGKFERYIYVPFLADEMIVRQITYSYNAINAVPPVNDVSFLIRTDMVNDFIGSASDPCSVSPNSVFKINKEIQGTYNFQTFRQLVQYDSLDGDLYIHLEFVKYLK